MSINKERFAAVLSNIRQGKGIKQKEITDEQMCRTTYSKIERGEIVPGIVNFYHILSKLNIGLEEFIYLYNDYKFDKRRKIINEFKKTRANFDTDKLTEIKNLCNAFLKNERDDYIANIRNICIALLKINDNDYDAARTIAEKVWEDLSKRDTWFFDDLVLINNIFFMFEGEVMEEIYKRAVKYLDKYEDFQDNRSNDIRFSLRFNKLSYDMYYGSLPNDFREIIDNLIIHAQDLRYYDIKAILFVRKGLYFNDTGLIEKGIRILEVIERQDLLHSVQEEIDLYASKYYK